MESTPAWWEKRKLLKTLQVYTKEHSCACRIFHSSVGGLLEGGAYLELSICKFGSSRNPPHNLKERNT